MLLILLSRSGSALAFQLTGVSYNMIMLKGLLSKETMHISDPSAITNQDFTCWLVTISSSLNT